MSDFKGVFTALVTPFTNGKIDEDGLRQIIQNQIAQGVDGFIINGTTGESPTLTRAEVQRLFTLARAECKLPLIVGTGSNSTAKTVELTEAVQAWKPDGVLVVVPYYNRPPQRGLKLHFASVAKASSVPVILYNVPSRTVAGLEPQTVAELSREHSNIVGLKDATGDMKVLAALKERCRSDFVLLSGDDSTCVEFAAGGGHGLIGVASHIIGKEMKQAMEQARKGDPSVVVSYKRSYEKLMRALYIEANPIPIKKALQMMGLIASAEMRLPLAELDEKFHKDLQACLKELGKI